MILHAPPPHFPVGNIEAELNSIKQELNVMRAQNINLYNELAKQHQFLLQSINHFNSQHLQHYLTMTAALQTSEFIIKNMPKVKSFESNSDIIRYSIEQCKVNGLYLEFGVFTGNTINFIADLKSDQIIYGFDSFEGLPEDWRTGFVQNTFNINGNLPPVKPNVQLVKGWFDNTLPIFLETHKEPCAFIHIDCDLYSSTKTVLSLLKNQIVPNTIILFDEYFNYPTWQEGEHKAFNEFVSNNGIDFEYIGYSMHEQVAVKIK